MSRRKRISIVKNIIIAVLALLFIGTLVGALIWKNNTKDLIYTQAQFDEFAAKAEAEKEEAQKQSFAEGREDMLYEIKRGVEEDERTILSSLKQVYKNYILCYSGGKLNFIPIDEKIPKNDYKTEYLVEDRKEPKDKWSTGELVSVAYEIDGQPVGRKGIDVSAFQGDIDWKKVAAQDIEFAFVRVMFRGYGSKGELKEDSKWKQNVKGAQAAGIKVGVYGVTMAVTEEEAIEEANYMLKLTEGYDFELPYVMDIEIVEDKTSRTYDMEVEQRTKCAQAFLNTLEAAGKKTMIYHNTEMGAALLDYSKFYQYPIWFANYTIEMYWPYAYDIWQYGYVKGIDGVKGDCDVNIWLNNFEEYLN